MRKGHSEWLLFQNKNCLLYQTCSIDTCRSLPVVPVLSDHCPTPMYILCLFWFFLYRSFLAVALFTRSLVFRIAESDISVVSLYWSAPQLQLTRPSSREIQPMPAMIPQTTDLSHIGARDTILSIELDGNGSPTVVRGETRLRSEVSSIK